MVTVANSNQASDSPESLADRYVRIRGTTLSLCAHLAPEDYVVQSMPDVSPTKWHLAHTSWFFERFVLVPNAHRYQCFDAHYHYLFNSYYYSAGQMHARPRRGLLTRPLVSEILNYRQYVDAAVGELLNDSRQDSEIASIIELGLHHEQQHQELLLTDIKHVFSRNPMQPVVHPDLVVPARASSSSHRFVSGTNGIREFGATSERFCFDNETPRHSVLLHEHSIGSRLITNEEYAEFMQDGGYRENGLWLSDGWATVQERGWNRPLYWSEDGESEFTLGGTMPINPAAPVTHVSFYEADAFARWAGARLATEFEWESAANEVPVAGNLLDAMRWHPAPAESEQMFGDVWEWTSSSYAAYPGFKPLDGSLGEYNGKFMCNQMTVRGGSCVTSDDHIRASYRSFFHADARWQFLGIRLAKDGAP
ncbi:MAG: ergothioneine biosynthesis protein EgtB [Gammaproteobacteria bacterium]|nr:ergothioneine biosynthesis protein EgtB [Gammaproteobacteria bacterium]